MRVVALELKPLRVKEVELVEPWRKVAVMLELAPYHSLKAICAPEDLLISPLMSLSLISQSEPEEPPAST
jgi:hypothetical protein